jgi:hypothetical protein
VCDSVDLILQEVAGIPFDPSHIQWITMSQHKSHIQWWWSNLTYETFQWNSCLT